MNPRETTAERKIISFENFKTEKGWVGAQS